jgi:outer membrane lipoprotein carrier protein
MRAFTAVFCLLSLSPNIFAQKDAEAVKVLDKFSAVALAAPSITMKFSLETVDQTEGTNKTDEGSIVLSRDKYRLDLTDNIVWFNGETSWSYLPAEKEVTISKPAKDDNSFQARPSALFSIYRKGNKVRLLEERADSYLIDLYPEDINSDHIRIRLTIGKPSYDLKNVEYKFKNGVTVTLKVKEYDLTQKPDNSVFAFSPDKYKGVEIVDMR